METEPWDAKERDTPGSRSSAAASVPDESIVQRNRLRPSVLSHWNVQRRDFTDQVDIGSSSSQDLTLAQRDQQCELDERPEFLVASLLAGIDQPSEFVLA